jgi:hypothetical protein
MLLFGNGGFERLGFSTNSFSFYSGINNRFGFSNAVWLFYIKVWFKENNYTSMILAGLTMIWYGHSTTLVNYAISLTLMITFVNAFAVICGFSIIANWFLEKKELFWVLLLWA